MLFRVMFQVREAEQAADHPRWRWRNGRSVSAFKACLICSGAGRQAAVRRV